MLEDKVKALQENKLENEEEAPEAEIEIIPDPEPKAQEETPDGQATEEPEEEADKAKQKRGKRAQNRIRGLITDKNALAGALRTAAEEIEVIRTERDQLATQLKKNRTGYAEEIGSRLDSEEARLKTANTLAVEQEDTEALFDIRQRQSEIAAEKVALKTLRQQEAEEVAEPVTAPPAVADLAPHTPVVALEPDPTASEWQEENPWFDLKATDIQGRIRTAAALMIHKDLMTEGFNPQEAATGGNQRSDYYLELDKRLADEFPGAKKAPAKGHPGTVVVGGARSAGGGKKTTKTRLTESEYALTKRLGIDPVKYAREKAKKLAAEA